MGVFGLMFGLLDPGEIDTDAFAEVHGIAPQVVDFAVGVMSLLDLPTLRERVARLTHEDVDHYLPLARIYLGLLPRLASQPDIRRVCAGIVDHPDLSQPATYATTLVFVIGISEAIEDWEEIFKNLADASDDDLRNTVHENILTM